MTAFGLFIGFLLTFQGGTPVYGGPQVTLSQGLWIGGIVGFLTGLLLAGMAA